MGIVVLLNLFHMKRILILLFSILAFAGCDGLLDGPGGLILGDDVLKKYSVAPEGESISLSFNSLLDWTVEVDTDAEPGDWIAVSPKAGPAANVNIVVTVSANESGSTRKAVLKIIAGTYEEKITFEQKSMAAQEKDYFDLSVTEVSMPSEGGEFELTVSSDHGYEVDVVCDWISELSSDSNTHVFAVMENTSESERTGVVTLCSELGICKSVTVTQAGAEKETPDQPEYVHKSLAIRFTADWCVYCPIMAENFRLAAEELPGKFEVLNIHGSGSSYQFVEYDVYADYFGVTGFPTGVVDFRRDVYETSSVVAAVLETEENYEVSTGIEASASIVEGVVTADVRINVRKAGEYRVAAIVAENGIVGYQNGVDSDYVHDRVARVALTHPLGNQFTVPADDYVAEFAFSGNVSALGNSAEMELIVLVIKEFGDQNRLSDYGDLYVDNCVAVNCSVEKGEADGDGEDITQGEDIEM